MKNIIQKQRNKKNIIKNYEYIIKKITLLTKNQAINT